MLDINYLQYFKSKSTNEAVIEFSEGVTNASFLKHILENTPRYPLCEQYEIRISYKDWVNALWLNKNQINIAKKYFSELRIFSIKENIILGDSYTIDKEILESTFKAYLVYFEDETGKNLTPLSCLQAIRASKIKLDKSPT